MATIQLSVLSFSQAQDNTCTGRQYRARIFKMENCSAQSQDKGRAMKGLWQSEA